MSRPEGMDGLRKLALGRAGHRDLTVRGHRELPSITHDIDFAAEGGPEP